MRRFKRVRFLTLGVALGALSVSGLVAEDTKGKWQFGFGLSYFSTMDYIRSNADIALSEIVVGDRPGLPPVQSVDERPDINVLNEPSINDEFKLDVSASYGLTRWLAVELAAGYLKAPVGNIEFYFKDQTAGITGSPSQTSNMNCGANVNRPCYEYTGQLPFDVKTNTFLPVGTITEIPIQLSALARFRPESPLDPYIGLGVGYIFTDLKASAALAQASAEVTSERVSTADKGDFTRSTGHSINCGPNFDQPCVDFSPGPIVASVKDSFQWHAVGGVDYYVNERFSFYVDARYVWTSGGVEIRTDGFPQVQFTIAEAGQLLLLRQGSESAPYLWEDTGFAAAQYPAGAAVPMCSYTVDGSPVSCAGDGLYVTEDKFGGLQNLLNDSEDKNGNLALDPGEDLNGNGVLDYDDNGVLYLLPPNTRDLGEAVDRYTIDPMGNLVSGADGVADTIYCDGCDQNGFLETEDKNGNTFMDTYLLYGIDICTFGGEGFDLDGDGQVDTTATDNPKCYIKNPDGSMTPNISMNRNHVWPAGCARSQAQVSLDFQNLNTKANVGCPPITGTPSVISTTGTDDASDVYIVQGGNIKLGGFSLGFGFKFLF